MIYGIALGNRSTGPPHIVSKNNRKVRRVEVDSALHVRKRVRFADFRLCVFEAAAKGLRICESSLDGGHLVGECPTDVSVNINRPKMKNNMDDEAPRSHTDYNRQGRLTCIQQTSQAVSDEQQDLARNYRVAILPDVAGLKGEKQCE